MKINRDYILSLAKEILLIPSPSGYPVEIIPRIEQESQKYNFWLLLHHLKSNMKFNKDNVPWK